LRKSRNPVVAGSALVVLLCAAIAVVGLAFVYVALSPPRVEVETSPHGAQLFAGEAAALPTVIRPRGRRSPSMRLEQALPVGLGGRPARMGIPPLPRGRKFTLDLMLTFMVRGRHDVPAVTLERDDPFGFVSRTEVAGSRRQVTVLPRVHDLDPAAAAGASLRGDGPARTLSVLPGDEWGSIRAYRAGDDLRRIHWPVTAHRGELMMRHDERSSTRHGLLLLDPRLPDRHHPEVLEWGIEMIASAAVALDRADMTFDLLTGDATVVGDRGEIDDRRDAALLALARTPVHTRPPRLGLTVQDPYVEAVRDQAARAGLVVLAAGVTDPDATRDLLSSLPPGTTGFAFLVAAEEESPAGLDLAAVAAEAGWSPALCTPATSHAQVWQDCLSARDAR
ncbi:MAG: DUF58 domain-containing protein, partial [Mobilicoccus sp.]|nr:DUF58 domain-containing protein [Mobilicoccus sp.]